MIINRALIKGLSIVIFVGFIFLIVGTAVWVRTFLPYEYDLDNASLRTISNIVIRDFESNLYIFHNQLDCQQPDPKQLVCQHELLDQSLSVAVQLETNDTYPQYECQLTYALNLYPCQAFETINTYGGIPTPHIMALDGIGLTAVEMEQLASTYRSNSIHNLRYLLGHGYFLLLYFALLLGAAIIWGKVGVYMQDKERRLIPQAVGTLLAMIPVSIVLFMVTFSLLISLYIDD